MVGTEAELAVIAVELLHEHFESALEVAHCDALVNYETLNLVEQGRVSSVNGVGTENSSGRDYTDRWLLVLHNVYLNGRGLGTEENGLVCALDVECILSISCRMIGREVQSLENVVIVIDLGTVSDIEAHADEYFSDLVLHLGKGVELSEGSLLAGESDVDLLLCQLCSLSVCLQ